MTKAFEQWNDQLVTASKLNQVIADHTTPGLMILCSSGKMDSEPYPVNTPWYHQPYPFTEAKSVYDRIRFLAACDANAFEYTLDAGGAWTAVPATPAPPFTLYCPGPIAPAPTSWDHTVDISGVAGATWFGVRWQGALAMSWFIVTFLYNSDQDPF